LSIRQKFAVDESRRGCNFWGSIEAREAVPEWLTIERAISILSVAIAAGALAYVYFRHRRPPSEKALCIDQHGPLQIAGVIQETDAPIRIDYANQRVEQVWRTLILLWNNGDHAIESNDFVVPISGTHGPKGRILACGVENMDIATNASVTFDRTMQKVRVEVTMLPPGEAVTLYFDMDAEQARPNLTLHLQNANWIVLPSRRHSIDPRNVGLFVWWLLFLIGDAAFVILVTNYTYWHAPLGNRELLIIGLVFVFLVIGIPTILGFAVSRSLRAIRARRLSPTVFDFYQRKTALRRAKTKASTSPTRETSSAEEKDWPEREANVSAGPEKS
jgi:hypothetical protein